MFYFINSVYDWIYQHKIKCGFLCAAGAAIIYLHYKKKKDRSSAVEFPNVAFDKNEIPSEPDVEFPNVAFDKNEIPSEPDVEFPNVAFDKNEIPSEPDVEFPNVAFDKNEIPSEPDVEFPNVAFDKNEIPSEPDVEFPNVAFYKNEIPSEPDGDYIENILTSWVGYYDKLEEHHNYIQWLFPNPEAGVNLRSHRLKDEEAKIIRNEPELKERVKRSFKMMLHFYGMELREENKFVLADNATKRLQELNQWGNHNFLRISRILLALKLLGHSDLMLPWMKLFVDLIYVEKVLDQAAVSFEEYWIETLDAEDKIKLDKYKNARK